MDNSPLTTAYGLQIATFEDLGENINSAGFAFIEHQVLGLKVRYESRLIPFTPPRNNGTMYLLGTAPLGRLPGGDSGWGVLCSVPRWFPDVQFTLWKYVA